MIKTIDERIRRFFNSVRMPFRIVIDRVTTGKGVKKVTGEPVKSAELFQHYGFQSVPPGATMGIAVALGRRHLAFHDRGDRTRGREHRPGHG